MSEHRHPLTKLFIGGLVLLLSLGLFFLLRTYEVKVTVARFEWSRGVTVEQYQTVRQEGWSIPNGGREVSSRRKIRSTLFIKAGNVTVPIHTWGDWYTYDLDTWVPIYVLTTEGVERSEPEPYWGQPTLRCANTPEIGCERENGRTETYTVILRDEVGNEYSRQEEIEDWLAYEWDTQYVLVFNSSGPQNDPLRIGG